MSNIDMTIKNTNASYHHVRFDEHVLKRAYSKLTKEQLIDMLMERDRNQWINQADVDNPFYNHSIC
jgi:hypothetical protein